MSANTVTKGPLKLLVAEDSEDDFEILMRELRKGGYEVEAVRVVSAEELATALERPWDLVVSDWSLPGFSGRAVLEAVTARKLETPCIVLSGTLGEEAAVDAVRAGALDFLSKDRPARIVPAVQRALRDAAERRAERRRTEEIQRRSAELELQNRRIQEADRLKSAFLANMSHELRTPLNAIIGFAELLHDGQVPPGSATHQEFLGDILDSGRHLLQLINDILDLSKVEAGKLDFRPEPIDLGRVLGEVAAILRTSLAQKQLHLDVVVDPAAQHAVLDPARFKQVAYNYLSNALQFSLPGGRITARISPEGDDHFRFEVTDTGVGISLLDQSRLFVEFQQLESGASKRHQGTGLGLALTRRLVEAQGGSVGVRSALGAGSTFHAILPRRAATTVAVPTSAPPRAVQREGARKVLVVEDDVRDQAQLVDALARAGYAVELAATGADALQRWRTERFDALTIDLLLPDMTGLDLLAALRAEGNHDLGTPVIVVTVVPQAKVVAGFTVHDILHKPVDPQQLIASLRRAGIDARPPEPT